MTTATKQIDHTAAAVAHQALGAAQAALFGTVAQAIDASQRPCFNRDTGTYPGLSGDLRSYDADYGSYTAHPMDPRTEPDDATSEMLVQVEEAQSLLSMARAALEGVGARRGTLAARSLMDEAAGFLAAAE